MGGGGVGLVEAVQKEGWGFRPAPEHHHPGSIDAQRTPLLGLPGRGHEQLADHLAAPEARRFDASLAWYIRPGFDGLT